MQETLDHIDKILKGIDWKIPHSFRAYPKPPLSPPPPKDEQSTDTHSYISTIAEFQQDIDDELMLFLKIDKDRNPMFQMLI